MLTYIAEAPDDSKPAATIKVDGQSVEIGPFAFDALQVNVDSCSQAHNGG